MFQISLNEAIYLKLSYKPFFTNLLSDVQTTGI